MVNHSTHINELLSTPEKLSVNDLVILENTLKEYPWFQAARSVHLKGLHNESSPLYNNALQVAATHTGDRGVLFDFITSPVFIQNRISNQIKKQQEFLKELPVEVETVQIKEEDLNGSVNFKNTLDTDLFERPQVAIDKEPIQFKSDETYSFTEWLKLTTVKPIERTTIEKLPELTEEKKTPVQDDRDQKMALIDQFLKANPKIKPSKEKKPTTNLADLNTPKEQLMTETLAQVYLAQKNYLKAIQAYEILVLQHPEKSGFFADRIQQIKNLQSNT
ncbi:hypothetical protein [Nonlabens sp.]|uniref:hypothetical protein n=1 Tax=Nonlabens sp. TaxID=1888209 RepID=UPI003F698DF4